jgi:hypothetical protein
VQVGEAASEDAVRRRYRQLGKSHGGAAAMAFGEVHFFTRSQMDMIN